MNLDDYLLKAQGVLPGISSKFINYPKIVAAPDDVFAEFYLALMTEYKEKDNWWSEGNVPNCSECHTVIPGPEELRRYAGASLHPHCFGIWYARNKSSDDTGVMGQYWARVSALRIPKKS